MRRPTCSPKEQRSCHGRPPRPGPARPPTPLPACVTRVGGDSALTRRDEKTPPIASTRSIGLRPDAMRLGLVTPILTRHPANDAPWTEDAGPDEVAAIARAAD